MSNISLQSFTSLEAIKTSPQIFDGIWLWWVMAEDLKSEETKLNTLLTDEEQKAAARFVTANLSWRYQVTRGVLRALLSHYLQQPPLTISIPRTDKGKPYLLKTNLKFNLSHAEEGVLYGFSWQHHLGVDVEYTPRQHTDLLGIAKRYFHPREYESLESLTPLEQPKGFYRIWTQKEAVLKATGDGIAHHLSACEISTDIRAKPALLSFDGRAIDGWHIHEFEPATGYLAAVAFEDS